MSVSDTLTEDIKRFGICRCRSMQRPIWVCPACLRPFCARCAEQNPAYEQEAHLLACVFDEDEEAI